MSAPALPSLSPAWSRSCAAAALARAAAVALVCLGAACDTRATIIRTGDMIIPGPDMALVRDLAYDAGPCGPCPKETPKCDAINHMCVVCLVDNDCGLGTVCMGGACTPGCASGHSCGDAGTCDVDAGLCRSCLADKDCREPGKPICDSLSGKCAACSPARDKCPDGQYCDGGGGDPKCAVGCKGDGDCGQLGAGGRCCNHVCVDINNSKDNCGACAAACPGGASCCAARCFDLTTDLKNCGACGKACGGANVLPTCAAGQCGVAGCAMGFGDCDKDPANGCEVSLSGNVANCGACGRLCAVQNGMPLCLGGQCAVGACNVGYRDCNLSSQDGCEVNVANDAKNCGACGANCGNVPHATAGCNNGACGISQCDAGYADCDRAGNNGCEVELNLDPKNCGACGRQCVAPPNVVITCAAGVCGMMGCVQGYADCNNNMADGCEAKLATDGKNCGMCGVVCMGQGQNAVAACAAGMCTLACNAGFGDCDNNPNNGCEKDLRSDASNCGACNNVCPQNMAFCIASACTASTHNIMKLAWDFSGGSGGCGDFSIWYSQNFGAMTFDQCEALANKYGAQFVGSPSIYAYNAPYAATVRWAGEADANNAYVTSGGWNVVNAVAKNGQQACILGYANANTPGNGTFNTMMVSNNSKAYMVNDYGVISEKVCYSNALAAGARPLNPWMFANAAKSTAHMIENHSCHGSTEWTGAPGYMADGGSPHTYRCLVGYNP